MHLADPDKLELVSSLKRSIEACLANGLSSDEVVEVVNHTTAKTSRSLEVDTILALSPFQDRQHDTQSIQEHTDHPTYPREDWRYDVASGQTQIGYWDWVISRISAEETYGA